MSALTLSACGGGSSPSLPVMSPPTGGGGSTSDPVLLSDLEYGKGATETGEVDLLLDIYQPQETCDGNRPTVFFVHGGGFLVGNKALSGISDRAEAAMAKGFNFVSINYRLLRDDPVLQPNLQTLADTIQDQNIDANVDLEKLDAALAAFEDAVVALNWLEANQNEYCLDMSRLAYWGSSAGAFTVLNVAYSSDEVGLSRPDPDVVINYWGAMLRYEDMAFRDAPFMTVHGDQDETVNYQNALDLAAQADAVDVPYSFYTDEGGGHGVDEDETINGTPLMDVTMDFIEAHIVGGTASYETVNFD